MWLSEKYISSTDEYNNVKNMFDLSNTKVFENIKNKSIDREKLKIFMQKYGFIYI